MKMNKDTIAERRRLVLRLFKSQERHGMSDVALGGLIGCGPSTISGWRTKGAVPTGKLLEEVTEAIKLLNERGPRANGTSPMQELGKAIAVAKDNPTEVVEVATGRVVSDKQPATRAKAFRYCPHCGEML